MADLRADVLAVADVLGDLRADDLQRIAVRRRVDVKAVVAAAWDLIEDDHLSYSVAALYRPREETRR